MSVQEIIEQICQGKSLSEQVIKIATEHLLTNDDVTDSEIAALLIGLRAKGETVEEIVGLVTVLREKSLSFSRKIPNVLDNCGTGGDGSNSFNISTTAAFVIAGAGIPVAKHGNRSISSKIGSADVLEHLGIPLNIAPERAEELIEEIGITFLFAPYVHPHLKRIMKVRNELRIPTIFNLIGPLINPIELETQVLGSYRRDLLPLFAKVLKKLGRRRAVVLNGAGFMDEASLQGVNHLVVLDNGVMTNQKLHPADVGMPLYTNEAIRGGDANENANILLNVLKGRKGSYRDTVLLNAGIGIYTAGKASSIQAGIEVAKETIDSGAAINKLDQLITISKQFREKVT